MSLRMNMVPTLAAGATATFLLLLLLAGCGPDEPERRGDAAGEPGKRAHLSGPEREAPSERWVLSEEPAVSIGEVEGDPRYQLHRVLSALRLPDGRIAALNAGSSEIRFYDPEGEYLAASGSSGEGPGEFMNPLRLWLTPRDSLLVFDSRTNRFSTHDGEGRFLGSTPFERPDGSIFPLDDWIHGRNLIESSIPHEARGMVLDLLDVLPRPDPSGPFRFAILTDEGHLWTTYGIPPLDSSSSWTVYDFEGVPMAAIEMPARFEVHQIGPDFILGVMRDELDVERIELYDLDRPQPASASSGGARPANPEQSADGAAEEAPDARQLSPGQRGAIEGTMRMLAGAQERHYAAEGSYSADPGALGVSVPDGVDLDFLHAGRRGWLVVVTDRESGVQCINGAGGSPMQRHSFPIGYQPGRVSCW